MHAFLKATVAGLAVFGAACGSAAAAPLDTTAELDYSQLPLYGLVAEVSECVDTFGTAEDPYWVPTQEVAEVDGYGIASEQAALGNGIVSESSVSDCGSAGERASLVGRAITFVQAEMVADGFYEGWSNCLADRGFSGLTSPSSRESYMLGQIYSGIDFLPEGEAIALVESFVPTEVELAQADIECQQQHIAPQLQRMAEFQQQVINDSPADVQAQLKG